VHKRSTLRFGVVVHSIAVGEKTQTVGHRLECGTEGIGRPADVPAD